jgi:hypothetical protein
MRRTKRSRTTKKISNRTYVPATPFYQAVPKQSVAPAMQGNGARSGLPARCRGHAILPARRKGLFFVSGCSAGRGEFRAAGTRLNPLIVSIVLTVVIVALVTLIVGIQLVRVIVEAVVMGRVVGVHAVAAVVIRRSAHGFAPENVNCTLHGGLSAVGDKGKHLALL